jgi:hypothetical protein
MQQFFQFIILKSVYSSTCFGRFPPRECAACLKYSVLIFVEKIHKVERLEGSSTPVLYIGRKVLKGYSKIKCTVVQALSLCTGRTAYRVSRGIALPFHDNGTRKGWGVSVTPRPLSTQGKIRYPLYRRLGGPQGQSGQVRKISPPHRDSILDCPVCSQSLYRLR